MPENQVKLIHVFMHKQLVLQTSLNSFSVHYKYMRLCSEKTDEDHEANLNHPFLGMVKLKKKKKKKKESILGSYHF